MADVEKSLQLTAYNDPRHFLAKIEPVLGLQETANNLMLGLAAQLIHRPGKYKFPPYLATIEKEGSLFLAALMTPPHPLLLWSGTEQMEQVFPLLVESLQSGNWNVPGVNGQTPVSSGFAHYWERLFRHSVHLFMSLRVYELQKVIYFPPVSGRLRLADSEHLDLVTSWLHAFTLEGLEEDDYDSARKTAENLLINQDVYLWEDDQPVSMSFKVRPTRKSICISGVYTPPALRRRGYASACVAHLSQLMLDSGIPYCCLFTDLANPTSNSIYQRIGYQPVCDYANYQFE